MGNGLPSKSCLELSQDKIHEESGSGDSENSTKEVGIFDQDDIPDGSHCAKPCSLGQKSHAKAHQERNQDGRML